MSWIPPILSQLQKGFNVTDGHVKIIIPCTNEGEWLRVTVDSILEHTDYPSFEIVVSANGDSVTDFSFIEAPGYHQVRLLRTERALGVGNGRNVAVSPPDAMYYVFLDSHCLVEQRDWLQNAVDCLRRHPHASMIQPEVVAFVHEVDIRPGERVYASQVTKQLCEYCTRWAWPYVEPGVVVENQTLKRSSQTFEAMSGAGMAIFAHADNFNRLGGFDSEVNGWFHETMDYCIRAWLLGYPMLVEPRIRIYHRVKMNAGYERVAMDLVHGALRTAYKYLSPRRRDLAEVLFRHHDLELEVETALKLVRRGNWLSERVQHLRDRVHDDDWLFSKFEVYEERFTGQPIVDARPASYTAGIK